MLAAAEGINNLKNHKATLTERDIKAEDEEELWEDLERNYDNGRAVDVLLQDGGCINCAPAALLGCSRRLSGSFSGVEP